MIRFNLPTLLFLIWVGLVLPVPLEAQIISQKLARARDHFDNGRFGEAKEDIHTQILSDEKIKRREESEAYRLLTEIYITISDQDSADKYMKLMLQHNWGLQMDASQPELYSVFRTFRTDPLLFFTPKVGLNSTQIIPYDNQGTGNTLSQRANYSPTYLSTQIGAGLDLAISRTVSIGLEAMLVNREYQFNDTLNLAPLNQPSYVHTLSFTEQHLWLDVPFRISYTFRRPYRYYRTQKIFPYINAGVTYSRLLSARFSGIRRESTTPEELPDFIAEESFDLRSGGLRAFYNMAISAGGGLQAKLGTNYLGLDFRFNLGFLNLVNPENRYNNPALVYKYGYVDDDMRMNQYALSLSYVIPIYHYKKRRAYIRPEVSKKPYRPNYGERDAPLITFRELGDGSGEKDQYEIVWEDEQENVIARSEGRPFDSLAQAQRMLPWYASINWANESNYLIQREKGRYYVLFLNEEEKPVARSEKTYPDLYEARKAIGRFMQLAIEMPKNYQWEKEQGYYVIEYLDREGARLGRSTDRFGTIESARSRISQLLSLRPINFDLRKEVNPYSLVMTPSPYPQAKLVFLKNFLIEDRAKAYRNEQARRLGLPMQSIQLETLREPYEIYVRDGDGRDIMKFDPTFKTEENGRFYLEELSNADQLKFAPGRLATGVVPSKYYVYLVNQNQGEEKVARLDTFFLSERDARDAIAGLAGYSLRVRKVDQSLDFRTPTSDEIIEVLESRAGRIGERVMDLLSRPSGDPGYVRDIDGLLNVIEQEIKRLAYEKRKLRKSLRKGPAVEVDKDIQNLKKWRKELKEQKAAQKK